MTSGTFCELRKSRTGSAGISAGFQHLKPLCIRQMTPFSAEMSGAYYYHQKNNHLLRVNSRRCGEAENGGRIGA